ADATFRIGPSSEAGHAMTAPERRRPLPALVFIGALSLFTALVWFRVLHRNDDTAHSAAPECPTSPTTSTSPSPSSSTPVVPFPHKVSVLVLNSTNRDGIAGDTSKALRKLGFKVAKAADDSATYGGHGLIKGVAEIRYAASALPGATLLKYYFPHAQLKATDSSSNEIMIALGAKFNQFATKKEVQHRLDQNNIEQRGTLPSPSKSRAAC